MDELDLAVRTLFAEFQESVFARFKLEQPLIKDGTFTKKRIKGKDYWYSQRYVKGMAAQKYHSVSTPKNDQRILQKRKDQQKQRALLKNITKSEANRAAMLKRGGLPSLDPLTASIISQLSAHHIIYEGGILIGSHAFAAYSGMLGIIFEEASLKTLDIDIAQDNSITISPPSPVNILEILTNCSTEFRAIPGLSRTYPPHSFIGPNGIRVDILAPLIGRPRGNIAVQNFTDAAAEPARFLDFLIKNPVSGVLLGPKGGIPATVPHPARFAIHKLIVGSYRPVTESAKRLKDILQADQLIRVCAKEHPHELSSAVKTAIKGGRKWESAIVKSSRLLSKESADILT